MREKKIEKKRKRGFSFEAKTSIGSFFLRQRMGETSVCVCVHERNDTAVAINDDDDDDDDDEKIEQKEEHEEEKRERNSKN